MLFIKWDKIRKILGHYSPICSAASHVVQARLWVTYVVAFWCSSAASSSKREQNVDARVGLPLVFSSLPALVILGLAAAGQADAFVRRLRPFTSDPRALPGLAGWWEALISQLARVRPSLLACSAAAISMRARSEKPLWVLIWNPSLLPTSRGFGAK